MQRNSRVFARLAIATQAVQPLPAREPPTTEINPSLGQAEQGWHHGSSRERSTMSEMPDAAWMDWIAGGLAIVVFVGGLVMMFTGILTSKNR